MSMKINKRPTSTRKKMIIATAIVILLAIVAASIYFFVFQKAGQNISNDSAISYDKPTNEQIEAGKNTKENSINPSDSSKPNSSGSDQATSPVPQDSGKSKVDATLISANQNGSVLQLRFDIGTVTNSGTCTLTLKKGSSIVTKTASVQALAGSTTCKGFDIMTSELSAGTWDVLLHFENTNLVADTTGKAGVK